MVYIETDSTDANFNFALEKYLMETSDLDDSYFLFWRTQPTLMIGKFQNTYQEINTAFARTHNINIVRRITGGGTIYTDMNGWQFSFIEKHPKKQEMDFDRFTRPVIDALASIGVTAYRSGRNDLLIDGRKISGNAQFKSRLVNLHHGSLLFNTDLMRLVRALTVDDEKLISKGIKSVKERVTNIADHMKTAITSEAFKDLMLKHITRDMKETTLTSADIEKVNQIKAQQFDTWEWNFGQNPKFNISKEKRFAGGRLTICVNVVQDVIQGIDFFGDFFEEKNLDELKHALIGIRYDKAAIAFALKETKTDDFIYQITADEILDLIID